MNCPSQITFLDGKFSLIHIPLPLYSLFIQPILQVLLPQGGHDGDSDDDHDSSYDRGALKGLAVDNKHGFLNISVTPVECSVVCHSAWTKRFFEPVIHRLPQNLSSSVIVSRDDYVILSVISAGMDAGSRVMELTSPLALAGIPIFFITTYYSDFILVPHKDRDTVSKALLARGCEFSELDSTYVSPSSYSPDGNGLRGSGLPPASPPPSKDTGLQKQTFDLLRKRNVVPYIVPDLSLVLCSGHDPDTTLISSPSFTRRGGGSSGSNSLNGWSPSFRMTGNGHCPNTQRCWLDAVDAKLYTSLISVLASQPRFLSLTLAQGDAPSLLVDRTALPVFGDSIVGDLDGDLVPVFLDLENLPLEATGIVSGVAGRLVEIDRTDGDGSGNSIAEQLSYLSTARAGAVILNREQSLQALEVMRSLLEKEEE